MQHLTRSCSRLVLAVCLVIVFHVFLSEVHPSFASLVAYADSPTAEPGYDPKAETDVLIVEDPRNEMLVQSQMFLPSDNRDEPQSWCLGKKSVKVVFIAPKPRPVFVTSVSGTGPGKVTLHYTKSVKNSFSTNVGISADAVSSALGFNVEWSTSLTYQYETFVPTGQTVDVFAFDRFVDYAFDVMCDPWGPQGPYVIGKGGATRFVGVYYKREVKR
nr:hypothetical protein [Ardenticatena sp.]